MPLTVVLPTCKKTDLEFDVIEYGNVKTLYTPIMHTISRFWKSSHSNSGKPKFTSNKQIRYWNCDQLGHFWISRTSSGSKV